MTTVRKRTCKCCGQRRPGCETVNDNPAVYCADCRVIIARHVLKKSFAVIRGGKD